MKKLLTIIFHSLSFLSVSFACSFNPISFCETSIYPQFDLIVTGVISSIDSTGIDLEIIHWIKGDESKSTIRIWDGTDFDCNGNMSMAAADLGNLNDTIIINLPRISEIENSWDVIGDYRRPDDYVFTPLLNLSNGTVTGFIEGDEFAPEEFNIYSYDYESFILSWKNNLNCSEIVSITNQEFRNNFLLFPNPVQDVLSIVPEQNNASFDVKIMDQFGKVIILRKNLSELSTISLTQLNNGLYFCVIQNQSNISSYKFIKT